MGSAFKLEQREPAGVGERSSTRSYELEVAFAWLWLRAARSRGDFFGSGGAGGEVGDAINYGTRVVVAGVVRAPVGFTHTAEGRHHIVNYIFTYRYPSGSYHTRVEKRIEKDTANREG